MRFVATLLLGLTSAPVLAASYECTVDRQCGGGTCEPFAGGPFVVEEAGDLWRITSDGQTWEGYATTTLDAGELSIVIPPANGLSGLVSIYPSGEFLFTAHAYGDGAVAITGMGTCSGEGG